jgi:predicted ATPase
MIRRIEALRYRCLRDVCQETGPFQVLVGPNGSGKSTFLDVVALLGDLLRDGLDRAIARRSPNIADLVFMGRGESFELAVELDIPHERRLRLPQNGFDRARFEVALGLDSKGERSVLAETLWLKPGETEPARRSGQLSLFPDPPEPRASLVLSEGARTPKGWKKVVTKKGEKGNDYFFAETTGWQNPFRLGPKKLALANLPEDEERFPVGTYVKRALMEGIHSLVLNSESMRRPAPPGSPREFQPDGSNLPWVIEELRRTNAKAAKRWIAHVRTALPDLESIETIERPEDKHRYLRVVYTNGLAAPSWNVSDGTLRLLALTLIAYLDEPDRVYLIEEPENGVHPQAVETLFQSLSSTFGSQVICATHSPVVLSLAEPRQLQCFAKTLDGVSDIVRGDVHPQLQDWKRSADLGTLFATGVLG